MRTRSMVFFDLFFAFFSYYIAQMQLNIPPTNNKNASQLVTQVVHMIYQLFQRDQSTSTVA